jgi:ornithine cyclodeaminase/alanine dehydrogenase-like protein (mu-crystallin family)
VSRLRVFTARDVERALSPEDAVEAVRAAFVAHAHREWVMPAKLYLTNYPAGDFRAMPALGGGHALLKWVSSFPGNPRLGLPTVNGAVLLSNAETGVLEALLDAGAVTALRTGAAAVLAAETLAREDATSAAVVGAGVNGRAAARTFLARGRAVALFDLDEQLARRVAAELGVSVARSRAEALDADIVVTVTPGSVPVVGEGELKPGQHISLMGADGPGKSEISRAELARARVSGVDRTQLDSHRAMAPQGRLRLFCDDWEQASHSGDIAGAVESGQLARADVSELGAVLTGAAPGRQVPGDITIFDSTGLAIQDLAVAIACLERSGELELTTLEL